MSLSLIAVFLPILLMGGLVGRIFREFALTLSAAILISLIISLTTTPMMCAYVLRQGPAKEGRVSKWLERGFERARGFYERTLKWALENPLTIMFALLMTVGLNVYLFTIIPKGFFPQQDTGTLTGGIRGDPSISFQRMERKFTQFISILRQDPAIEHVVGFTGGGGGGGGFSTATSVIAGVLRPRWSLQLAFTVILPGAAPVVFSVAVLPLPEIVPLLALKVPTVTGTLSGLVQVQLTATFAPACTLVGEAVQDIVGGFFGSSFTRNVLEAEAMLFFFAFGSVTLTVAVQLPPAAPFVSMLAVVPLPVIFPQEVLQS